ncbi:anti-sigma factor [uncultured Methylovirgula sp.]|uniref:anti-sigma factor n=1 Tax=uncultured Methylovirgula sp. TaxID=1285960 RepID=UPI002636115E|nr:anti-sigma factor [uncultured Methylovirgula sp.]
MTGEIDMQAAEYVLGTLSAEERSAFEALMKSDASAQRAVEAWQRRLAPLNVALGEVAPPAHIWHAIAQALAAPSDNMAPVLLLLRRSRNRWRLGALLAGVIAAGLAAFSIDRALIAHNEPQGSYIAVVNRSGDQPALIIRVDLATRTVFVRPVATDVPQGRSLELWYIGSGLSPKSMGLIDKTERNIPLPESAPIEKANFAVSVEPPGGSPSGAPTGPIVYSGQLLKE